MLALFFVVASCFVVISKREVLNWNIQNCLFDCMYIENSNGGAVMNDGNGKIYLRNNVFSDCSAPEGDGGAVYFRTSSADEMMIETNCFFRCMSKSKGGALYLAARGKIFVKISSILECGMTDDNAEGVVHSASYDDQFSPFVFETTNITHSVGTLSSLVYANCISETKTWQVHFGIGSFQTLYKISKWNSDQTIIVTDSNFIGTDETTCVLYLGEKVGHQSQQIKIERSILFPFPLPGARLFITNSGLSAIVEMGIIDSRLNTTSVTIEGGVVVTADMGARTYIPFGNKIPNPVECGVVTTAPFTASEEFTALHSFTPSPSSMFTASEEFTASSTLTPLPFTLSLSKFSPSSQDLHQDEGAVSNQKDEFLDLLDLI